MELRLENASIQRGSFRIPPVSLSIDPGLSILMGRSGSGKTTLLMMLSSLIPLCEGRLLADGKELQGHSRRIAVIFQHPERQLFASTVFSDVSSGLSGLGLDRDEIRKRTEAALVQAGIDRRKWTCSPFSLSGGERRRAAIAGALIAEPDAVLMDEPDVGLDDASRSFLSGLVASLRDRGCAVLMTTHGCDDAEDADRVMIMEKGRIVQDGTPDEVLSFTDEAVLSTRLGLGRIVRFEELADRIAERMRGME